MSQATSPIIKHQWAAGGVSTYPLTHPIVGQGTFYRTFKQFIHVVDQESEQFAHVFAIIAQWGIGKSRLAYELISQINNSSRGWYVRNESSSLGQANLFNNDADREQYLGLYIRYSQVANEHHNIDNWFGYGLYKSLLPLVRGQFDSSIQGQIAQEAYDRLLTLGFDENQLAQVLEIDANHSDEELYEDPYLVTRLCQAAYDYLKAFGIKYILVALDELETVAETSTYGLEDRDVKHMDGRAIKLLGKAIKEEDPRRKLPWLRYVALCSPAIGDELREIQSTARRFELVELSQNAFADVSDFVRTLAHEDRLSEEYPQGLVEAAYAMSGGNFGWFNVIMANVDGRMRTRRLEKQDHSKKASDNHLENLTVATLFDEIVQSSSRIRDYVLDYNAISELTISRAYVSEVKELLYGQLPVPFDHWQADQLDALFTAQNEYNEPIALRYRQVEWDELACSEALRRAKFERVQDEWKLDSVSQHLDLRQLLDNLSTYAIYACRAVDDETHLIRTTDGKRILLVPINQAGFIELVSFLYPHPAAEDAALALWQHFLEDTDIPEDNATHIGPSIAMLERLDLRYRKRNQTSLIFRDPDQSSAHEQALGDRKQQHSAERSREMLTAIMRVLDQNWSYDALPFGTSGEIVAIATPRGSRGKGGLVTCDGLKLHPQGRAMLAWVQNEQDLDTLCESVTQKFGAEGKTPVLAFTTSRALVERLKNPSSTKLQAANRYLLLYQLSTNEEYLLQRIGLHSQDQRGFKLEIANFNTAFTQRINAFKRGLLEEIQRWRHKLNQQGAIAWPLRPGGNLKSEEKERLRQAWRYALLETNDHALYHADENSGFDPEAIIATLDKLALSPKIRAAGYSSDECANLFSSHSSDAVAKIPPFLVQVLDRLLKDKSCWTDSSAKQNWFWGYTWEGAKTKDIFTEWLNLAVDLGFAIPSSQSQYEFLPTSTLRARIQSAENWLNQDYKTIVHKMLEVFGDGTVSDLFGDMKGTETVQARSKIEQAKEYLKDLEAQENDYAQVETIEDKTTLIISAAQLRVKLMVSIDYVFNQDLYASYSEENIKNLDLFSPEEPLWRRIRRAGLFSDRVIEISNRIITRIEDLQAKMRSTVRDIPHFPTQMFTLSLEKIRHILEGAIQQPTAMGSTAQQQMMDATALGQCLKGLRIAEAMNRLSQLSREVGLDIGGTQFGEIEFDHIDGQIISRFNRFKQGFENLQEQLRDTNHRINKLEKLLQDAPTDFQYPNGVDSLEQIKKRPGFIKDSLASIQEDEVEALREDPLYDKPAKQGNFQPLMQAVNSLLDSPKNQLTQLRSQLTTLENKVGSYLTELLGHSNIQSIESSFNQLLLASKQPPRQTLTRLELEQAPSLKVAQNKVAERRNDWVNEGKELLPAPISFERWQRIVETIKEDKDPNLSQEEAESLVRQGLLVRSYRLGGQ